MIREKPYEYHPLEIKCKCCGATVQYDYDDPKPGKTQYGYDYDVTPYYIRCPRCGSNIMTGSHSERSYEGALRDYHEKEFWDNYEM